MNSTIDVEIETSILIEIRRLIRATEKYATKLADRHGITVAQLVVIQEIDSVIKIDEKELGSSLGLRKRTIQEILDRLERLDIVERVPGRKEPAKVLISLTEKGKGILDKDPPLLQDTLIEELEEIDDWQKSMLLASFQRINNLLEAEKLDAAPILTAGKITQPEPLTNGKIKQILRPEKEKARLIKVETLEQLKENIEVDDLANFVKKHMKPFHDPPEYTKKGIRDALTGVPDDGGFVILAYLDHELVGTLVMLSTGMDNYIPPYCLLFIGVNGDYRGLGIGQQIMDYALEEAGDNVYLHVDYDNPAKHLYERMGFLNSYAEMRYYKKRIVD